MAPGQEANHQENTPIYILTLLNPTIGVYRVQIIFLILLKNIDCGYSLEPPRPGGSNGYPQSLF